MPAASTLPRLSTVTRSQMSKIRSAWCSTSSTPVPCAADGLDQGAQAPDLLDRQSGGRLVEHQEGRPQHQRARDLHEAQLAVLQSVGAHARQADSRPTAASAGIAASAQLRFVAMVARQRQQRFGEAGLAVDRAADHHVLQHRRGADQARRLEGAGDAMAGAQMRRAGRQGRRRPAAPAPALRRVVAGDDVQRRRLAAAVGADQAVHLAGADLEVEPVDGPHAAEMQRDALEREQSPGCRRRVEHARPAARAAARSRDAARAAGGSCSPAGRRCRPGSRSTITSRSAA